MALNIIDLIKGQLGPALVSQAATQYGESESGISKAVSGLLPAVIGGLANHSSNPTVLDAITGTGGSGLLGNLLGGTSNNSLITSIIASIFGDKASALVNAISGFAGVGNNTANSLLSLVTGATLGSVGKYAADNNLDRHGITNLLNDQKGIVSTLLPAGLSLGSLGLGNMFGGENVKISNTAGTATSATTHSHIADEPKVDVTRGGNTHVNVDKRDDDNGSIWKWLLPLLLLLAAGWFIWKQCDKKNTDTTTTTTDSTAVNNADMSADTAMVTSDTVAANGATTDIDLNGTPLKGRANGLEQQMVDYLKSGAYTSANEAALKDKWFNFDNVNFVFGKSNQITPESNGQLENLAAILKAYPDAKIKIGGYTDKKGDDAANKKLSQERADFIKAQLTKLGVGTQITGAEGYGEEHATVAETASDKERETDRKMAVRFTK